MSKNLSPKVAVSLDNAVKFHEKATLLSIEIVQKMVDAGLTLFSTQRLSTSMQDYNIKVEYAEVDLMFFHLEGKKVFVCAALHHYLLPGKNFPSFQLEMTSMVGKVSASEINYERATENVSLTVRTPLGRSLPFLTRPYSVREEWISVNSSQFPSGWVTDPRESFVSKTYSDTVQPFDTEKSFVESTTKIQTCLESYIQDLMTLTPMISGENGGRFESVGDAHFTPFIPLDVFPNCWESFWSHFNYGYFKQKVVCKSRVSLPESMKRQVASR